MAPNMNTHTLLSTSITRDLLTLYAEGLTCDNFDKNKYSNVHWNIPCLWLVLNKQTDTISPQDENITPIRFDQVKIVQKEAEQFMLCSCGHC